MINRLVKNVQYAQSYLHNSFQEATANALHARDGSSGDTAALSKAISEMWLRARDKELLPVPAEDWSTHPLLIAVPGAVQELSCEASSGF